MTRWSKLVKDTGLSHLPHGFNSRAGHKEITMEISETLKKIFDIENSKEIMYLEPESKKFKRFRKMCAKAIRDSAEIARKSKQRFKESVTK